MLGSTETYLDTDTKLKRIAWLSASDPHKRFDSLMHHFSDGELRLSEEGVVQGSICSPALANVFAHYVIDTWFEDTVMHHC